MSTKQAAKRRSRARSLRCDDCGFRAAHPMGLGRHRSARHGITSKRALMARAARVRGVTPAELTRIARRINALEHRVDALTSALLRAGKNGRR